MDNPIGVISCLLAILLAVVFGKFFFRRPPKTGTVSWHSSFPFGYKRSCFDLAKAVSWTNSGSVYLFARVWQTSRLEEAVNCLVEVGAIQSRERASVQAHLWNDPIGQVFVLETRDGERLVQVSRMLHTVGAKDLVYVCRHDIPEE